MSEPLPTISKLFNSSHAQFLEKLDNQEFWCYAQELAHEIPASQQAPAEYLICHLVQGRCILPLAALCEVVPPPHQFTLLPASPDWMHGVAAWRGSTIAVVDLDAYLSQTGAQLRPEGLLLVTQLEEVGPLTLGLLVTLLGSTMTLSPEQVLPLEHLPDPYSLLCRGAVKGLYEDALLLNLPVILTDIVQQIKAVSSYG